MLAAYTAVRGVLFDAGWRHKTVKDRIPMMWLDRARRAIAGAAPGRAG
jgi:hypothetical protein